MNLPSPKKTRWQPLRGGLMNLYHFDHLRLRYEDGRLLLRGNNGTGKSRILALQLPFLLDGEIAPSRVEPDGDPSKRIEWHLLLDGRYTDRVGYTWLEFGRLEEDGTPVFKTIGCGMKAIAGQGAPTRWYFVTDQRIDSELPLAGKTRIPLTRQGLQDVIGEFGRVFERASEYRVAVDQALFGLGEQRYGALLDLLIQLRRPQLSRKLDEKLLSDALSKALPPLSDRTLGDVAEAFRSLESDRHGLEQNRSALESTETFEKLYRRYVQTATRRRADVVRRDHSEYEHTMRRLRDAQGQLEQANLELERLAVGLHEGERERRQAEAAVHELETDPTQRDAKRLLDAEEEAKRARVQAEQALERVARSREALHRASEATSKASDKLDAGRSVLAEARAGVEEKTVEVGLGELLVDLDVARVEQRVAERDRHALHLIELAKARAIKRGEFEQARQLAQLARAELDRAAEAYADKQADRDRLREELEIRLGAWLELIEVLALPQTDALFEAIADWSERGEGEGPLAEAVARAHSEAVAIVAARDAELGMQRRTAREELVGLEAERDELSSGSHRHPRAPAWRDDAARSGREGAPLWALCDFQAHVGADQRVAFEAALEASGILDAWVTPDGRLLGGDDADVFLVASEPVDRSLASILVPAIDDAAPHARHVDEAVVARILASIGCEPEQGWAWVAEDGAFALGPIVGRARKDSAEHIGHAAREQARRRRLAVLGEQIEAITARLEDLDHAIAACGAQRRRADHERLIAPLGTPLRDAVRELAAAEREQNQRAQHFRTTSEARERAANELQATEDALRTDAEQLGLSKWIESLPALQQTLQEIRRALDKVWAAKQRIDAFEEELADRRETERSAAEALEDDAMRVADAEELADKMAGRYQVLLETVGAKVDELQRKLIELRERSKLADRHLQQLRDQKSQADQARGAASTAVEAEQTALEERERRRADAIGQLQSLARTGVLANIDEDWRDRDLRVDWSPTAAVDIARDLEKQLQKVDTSPAVWERVMSTLQREVQELTSALSAHGYNPTATHQAEILVVTIAYQGRPLDPSALAQTLNAEIASRQRLLDEREREILENHLLVEVASHLRDRIRGGERLVSEMNAEIVTRPLSTGMTFRFKWAPRSEPELVETRKRLLAAQGVWSPADRTAIGSFLQQRIQDERAASETGTWLEHLNKALDYREWHEFQIERKQNETWTRLTRRTYGTGSGGEKAIALTLPQLAAAAAHYRSASPNAPRLILMDEAFVGVDSDMREKCMGLLTAFDLDFVMTSEREWGCFKTVPALAIYQLVTRPGVDAVHETRWVWNGVGIIRDVDEAP